ncbi:MAG TPA: hypothetical protein VK698_15585, partial [Kofleriaceae bacterium]|nr:hypothetical protein [Kofleriaceae bacterium]
MTCRSSRPTVDPRDRAAIEAALRDDIAGHVPGWRPGPGSASGALLEMFTHQLALLAAGLDQVPARSKLAFLDMLGAQLLPARSARAPLVFALMETASSAVTVPANTRIAAPAAPAPASPLAGSGDPSAPAEAVVFATTQAISVTPARLAALHSVRPADDEAADHVAALTTGFTLFDGGARIEHALYLGHDAHFAVQGAVTISVSFRMVAYPAETIRQGLSLRWAYLADGDWVTLAAVEDGTEGLTRSGTVTLASSCGPAATLETIDGHESYWLRAVLDTPLPPEGAGGVGRLPAVDVIQARVAFNSRDLPPDAAFSDTAPVDTSNRFWPFGRRPERHVTFYLACEEAFSRASARVTITFRLVEAISAAGAPRLAWEYHAATGWLSLEATPGFTDETADLT